MKSSHHADESARLANLAAYQILDTPPEAAFERIVNLAQQALGMPIAAVSFVDRDREWFKAGVGFTLHDIPRQDSFCAYTILETDLLVVPDATADPRFADNPYVTGGPRIRFYVGAPLRTPEGQAIGTLAVMDDRPHDFEERQREILRDLASLLVDELSLRTQHQKLRELHLSVEARTAELIQSNRALHAEIRHRRSADDQHQRIERHFRQLFDQASDAAFVHDLAGRLVDVNAAACASLGYSREELLELSITDFETARAGEMGGGLWRDLAVGSVEKFEGYHRRKDGSLFPVEIHVSVLDISEGRHWLALVRDITARKRSEDLLRVRARNQEAIARLGSRALSSGNEDALLQEAVALVGETLGVERCRVHEHLAERSAFVVRASLDPADPGFGVISSDDEASSVPGYVLRHKDSPEEHSRAVNTVNAHLRNARSLFTPKALEFAAKRLALPDPLPFATLKLERKRGTTRYTSRIDPTALVQAAQEELGKEPGRREQFKIFCLALLCGLRKREIDTLLWRSVDLDKAIIRIERTEYFQPKSEESAGAVDLAPQLVEMLRAWKTDAQGPFVITSPNPPRYETSRTNYRAQREFLELGAWLEEKGVSARKKLHELRKECGAVIANSLGIFAASRALRHADIRITSQYYTDKKVRITTGLDALLT